MNAIDNITNQANQLTQVVLPDGSTLSLTLRYEGATGRWTLDVAHPLLTVDNLYVSCFPNLLRSWRNLVPFGLACATVSGEDPTTVDDFVNGIATLYVLTQADVLAVEETIFGGVLQ